jgi:hypothetical protein
LNQRFKLIEFIVDTTKSMSSGLLIPEIHIANFWGRDTRPP